tara:strand:- start:30 stop:209 length:180 start_codon:yes stop_codon:yes gene_type:complete
MKCFEQKSTGSNRIYQKGKCRYCGVEKGKPHLLTESGGEYWHGWEDLSGTNPVVWEKRR